MKPITGDRKRVLVLPRGRNLRCSIAWTQIDRNATFRHKRPPKLIGFLCVVPRILWIVLATVMTSANAWSAPDDIAAVAPPPPPLGRQQFNNFEQIFNNLEANVFQQHGSAQQARTSLECRLKLQIEELHRICELTDEQRQKLRLAGSNDIRRYFEEFEALRKKYQGGKKDQEAWNNFWQEMQPLQRKLSAGLFGPESFFAKSTRMALKADQAAKYKVVVDERRTFHYRACIEQVLETLENAVPLRGEQRDAIAQLLIEETSAPLAFGQHDHQVVMYNLTTIPEKKLRAVLDARQWTLMEAQLNQNLAWDQWLIQQGLLAKEDLEAKRPKVRVRRQIKRPNSVEAPADAMQPENERIER